MLATRPKLAEKAVDLVTEPSGQTYLVTGGAGGVGRAVGRRLVDSGHRVIIADRDADAVAAVVRDLGRADGVVADLADPLACLEAVDVAVAADGALAGAVTCAALLGSFVRTEQTVEQWDRLFAVNARASYLVAHATARKIAEQGRRGSVVMVSSGAARIAMGIPAYSATKGAVEAVMRELSYQWAPHGVRVNVVSPGAINTDMLGPARTEPDKITAATRRVPLGRIAEPDEIAAAIVFLLSDGASYITGTCLDVDGGHLST